MVVVRSLAASNKALLASLFCIAILTESTTVIIQVNPAVKQVYNYQCNFAMYAAAVAAAADVLARKVWF